MPELRDLFEFYIYGVAPADAAATATEVAVETDLFGGAVVYETHELRYGPDGTPPITLSIFRPAGSGPFPTFLAINKCGAQSLTTEAVRATESWIDGTCGETVEESRGVRDALWPIETIVGRGFALATFHESDVDPDDSLDFDFENGVHPHFASELEAADVPPQTRWGTIAAWAYGMRRVVDYLKTRGDIAQIGVTGHSRRGKAALLAAAFDERIDLAVTHQSGTAGATLSRSFNGESVSAINLFFPLWFNDVFPDFGDNETRLPVDQHLLLAMVAPRPLLVTNGSEDDWADPPGALRALEAAHPVYELLGSPGIVRDMAGEPALEADLGWAVRPGGHSLELQDWELFLQFAEHHFGGEQ